MFTLEEQMNREIYESNTIADKMEICYKYGISMEEVNCRKLIIQSQLEYRAQMGYVNNLYVK